MEIQSPFYLLLLIFIPFLIFWYQKNGKNNEAVFLISSKEFLSEGIINSGRKKNILLKSGQLLILILIIIGLSRPHAYR